jgi:hypothetical protein
MGSQAAAETQQRTENRVLLAKRSTIQSRTIHFKVRDYRLSKKEARPQNIQRKSMDT